MSEFLTTLYPALLNGRGKQNDQPDQSAILAQEY